MLAHTLAMAIALGSFSLYMAAFFFPEVHRKYDFIWSGVGFFYALVLWVCAGRITGGVLLGQTASVALLGWFGWQTLEMRRRLTPTSQQTQLPGSAKTLGGFLQFKLAQFQATLQGQLERPRSGNGFANVITRGLATAIALSQGLLNTTKPKKKKPTIVINRPPRSERPTPPVPSAPVARVEPIAEPIAASEPNELTEVTPNEAIVSKVQNKPLPEASAPPPTEKPVSPTAVPKVVKKSAPKPNPLTALQTRIQEILDRFKRPSQPTKTLAQDAIAPTAPATDSDLDAEFDDLFSDLEEPISQTAPQDDSDLDDDFADAVESTVEVEVVAVADPFTDEVIIQETIVIEETPIEPIALEENSIAEDPHPEAISDEMLVENPTAENLQEDLDTEAISNEIAVEERSPEEPPTIQVDQSEPAEAIEAEALASNLPNQVASEERSSEAEAIEDDHISVLGDGVAIEDTTEQQPS